MVIRSIYSLLFLFIRQLFPSISVFSDGRSSLPAIHVPPTRRLNMEKAGGHCDRPPIGSLGSRLSIGQLVMDVEAKIKQMVPERPIVRQRRKSKYSLAAACPAGPVVVITRIIGR
jgi:hypothetical protein